MEGDYLSRTTLSALACCFGLAFTGSATAEVAQASTESESVALANVSNTASVVASRSFELVSRAEDEPLLVDFPDSFTLRPSISADGRFVAFRSSATNLVAGDTNSGSDIFVYDRDSDTTELLNAGSNSTSTDPAISADGRFVAFISTSDNLVAGDNDGFADVFLYDRNTNATELLTPGPDTSVVGASPSISADGRFVVFSSGGLTIYDRQTRSTELLIDGFFRGGAPSISGDGRFVAFRSPDTDLVAGDNNGVTDIFIHDRDTGITERVTTGGPGETFDPSISANGRFVAFESQANNLVVGDTNAGRDIFVYDRETGTTELLTQGANSNNNRPSISADGRFVAFASSASNLVAGDINGNTDIFIYDRETDVTELVTQGADAFSRLVVISADGQTIAFETEADNLVTGDAPDTIEVVVFDRTQDNFERIPSAAIPFIVAGSNGLNRVSSISANGQFVAFQSLATNLVTADTNGNIEDLFLYNRETQSNVNITQGGNGRSFDSSLSADGRFVAFTSSANNLAVGDTNNRADVFVYDRDSDTTQLLSAGGNDNSSSASISGGGRFVAFSSFASNLVAGDANGQCDIFLYNRETQSNVNITQGGNARSSDPSLSADGRFVAFTSSANNLATGDTNDRLNVFVYDRDSGTTQLLTAGGNGNSFSASISGDGRFVAFSSSASNLVAGDTNGQSDIFVYDRDADTIELLMAVGDEVSSQPSISADGQFVAFQSDRTVSEFGTLSNVFVFDRDTNTIESVTEIANASGGSPSISGDGQVISFHSGATNLANDGTSYQDVFVAVANNLPTADSITVATNEDTPVAVTVTGFDPEQQALTFEVVTPPANGALTGTAPDFIYTPNTDFFGTDSFTFAANDGTISGEPATVGITVVSVNDAPVASGIGGGVTDTTTAEDTSVALTLEGNDVDGDPLTYVVVTAPASGTLSGTAPNLTYTPTADFSGADAFSFAVSDGTLTSATVTISITVESINDAPVAVPQSLTTSTNSPLAITLTGNDSDTDALSFAIVGSPANGTLSGALPDLVYTPANGFVGTESFTFTVSDGTSISSAASVLVEVIAASVPPPVNTTPVADALSVSTPIATPVSVTLTGSDADGDPLNFTIVSPPANGALSGMSPDLVYTPDANFLGADSFVFAVSDGQNTSAATTVAIEVVDGSVELLSAVLPTSRSVEVGATATAFATLINSGVATAQGCSLRLPDAVAAEFFYQTSDSVTNEAIGLPNQPVSIPPGGSQSFVFGVTPTEEMLSTAVALVFQCENSLDAPSFVGLNTLLLSASATPVPDLIALAATLTNNGVMELDDNNGFFTAATINVGSAATITVSADTAEASLPMALSLCQTDPATSVCINPEVPSAGPVIVDIAEGDSPTFAVFASASEPLGLDPATSRVFLRFSDELGVVRGATSVAVQNARW